MSDIRQDVTPAALVTAIEANLWESLPVFARVPGAALYAGPDLTRVVTQVQFPIANAICHARLTPEHLDAEIEAAMEPFRARAVPMLWWVTPSDTPANLGERLVAHGLVPRLPTPGMAVDLRALPELQPPDGVRIERVRDNSAVDDMAVPLRKGFEIPDVGVRFFCDLMKTVGFAEDSRTPALVAYLNDEPVACSLLVPGGGVAGIYNVATVPHARGQGIGSAVTLAALHKGRALGYRIGVLQASAMGFPVYLRLGFREYCKVATFMWSPELGQRILSGGI